MDCGFDIEQLTVADCPYAIGVSNEMDAVADAFVMFAKKVLLLPV